MGKHNGRSNSNANRNRVLNSLKLQKYNFIGKNASLNNEVDLLGSAVVRENEVDLLLLFNSDVTAVSGNLIKGRYFRNPV